MNRHAIIGNRVVIAALNDEDFSVLELSAIGAANDIILGAVTGLKPYRWARQVLEQVADRPADGDPFQAEWDAHKIVRDNASAETIALFNSPDGLEMVEAWGEGIAWTPTLSINTNIESENFGLSTLTYTARTPTAAEVGAEREAAYQTLRSQFQSARDAGVTINGARIETTPQAQTEIKSLRDFLAGQPGGTTQTFRTRAGDTVTADLATAEAILAAVETRISGVWANDAALGAQLDAAIDIPAIRAIDLSQGWPA